MGELALMILTSKRSFARVIAAVLLVGVVAVPTLSERAEASFPGSVGRLYFTRNEGTYVQVYSMEPGGGDVQEIATNYLDLSFAPDGRSFAAIGYSTRGGLFSVSADGSAATSIPDESDGGPSAPSYSPDGTRIMMQAGERHIGVINLANRRAADLRIPGLFSELEPEWSPDGRRIVFVGVTWSELEGFDREIYVSSPNGQQLTQLTDGGAVPRDPTWSPDGTMIAFETTNTPEPDVLVVPAAGGEVVNITSALDGGATSPTWSPGGSAIAFIFAGAHVWTMEPTGANPSEIFPGDGSRPVYDVAWQPLCTVIGTPGDDAALEGTSGDDRVCGLGGADQLIGGDGDDALLGGPGADELSGGLGDDVIAGGSGSDLIIAGAGNDILAAGLGAGLDSLRGGPGLDQLFTRDERRGDVADGGGGVDRCTADRTDTVRRC